jgi:ABC-2 type transport system ATP-binding protein
MSVTVQSLTKNYGTQKAIDALNFDIKKGEIVGLLGPNGSGKSTTMKILTCFVPQTHGTATVCGYDVRTHSHEVRRSVGYLPENNPLYTDMYIKEYLAYVAGIYKVPNPTAQVNKMIELTGLGIEQHKKIAELSKGYRQRVGLAQALIHNPEVLILDEPTTGLDPNQLVEIRKVIQQISHEKTIILSTHIMQEVQALCQRVIIINKGTLVADAPTQELKNQENTQKTAEIIIEITFDNSTTQQQLRTINGVIAAQNLQGNQWQIVGNAQADTNAQLFDFAVKNGLKVLNMTQKDNDLEAVFRQLTQ